ncbi:MAG: NUDIX hydrolase [Desulfobacterales bacterium]|nr:MAG: NUDIX hydrolase [Desulfobacterales bacterium]
MQIKSAEKLTNFKWLNLFNVQYIDKNGDEKSWQLASREKEPKCLTDRDHPPNAVVIVPFHRPQGKLVITREYRVPLGGEEYGFPAGLVDKGETVQEAARRELKEETGLDVTRLIRTSPAIYSSAGMTDESVAMVFVECDGGLSTARTTSSEAIEVMLISAPEASRLCNDPSLKFDAKAWLVLYYFAANGHL